MQTWDSCLFTPEEERAFLSGYLYPQLRAEGLTDVEVYIWDHNKDNLFDRAEQVITPDVRTWWRAWPSTGTAAITLTRCGWCGSAFH